MTTQPDPTIRERLRELAARATPGPYEVRWPAEQGGAFMVWGKQGEPPFTDPRDGWAIPYVASGVDTNMEFIAALLNALPVLLDPELDTLERRVRAAEGALETIAKLDGFVFASDDKERPVLAQSVVRQIARTALSEARSLISGTKEPIDG